MSNKNKNQAPPSSTGSTAPGEPPQDATQEPPQAPPEAPSEATAASPEAASTNAPPESPETGLSVVTPPVKDMVSGTLVSDIMNPDKMFDPSKPGNIQALVELFPLEAKYLKQLHYVSDDELLEATLKLPEPKAKAFQDALERMSPVKLGSHSRRRDNLTFFDVRINHGTGNDETRPKGTPEGALYGTDSRILATSDRDLAATLRAPETLDCYIIVDRRGNTYWPPKGDDAKDKPEGETRNNAPLCRSVDAEKGDTFGTCAACPNRPFVNGPKPGDDECRGELVIYLVPVDFSGVYRMVFTGTNTKAGRTIIGKKGAWRENWSHPFSFRTHKEVSKTDKDQRWFLVEADPQRNVTPTDEERAFLRCLVNKIETEVYFPERRRIHLDAAKAKATVPAVKANLKGLLASSQADAPVITAQSVVPLKDLAKGNNL